MSIISHRHKFIFVCPRKVATTSILASLAPRCAAADVIVGDPWTVSVPEVDDDEFRMPQSRNAHLFPGIAGLRGGQRHLLPATIRQTVEAGVWDDYFKFTVVRNPWDWFVSMYCWKVRGDWPRYRQGGGGVGHRSLRGFLRTHYRLYRSWPNYALGRHRRNVEMILKRGWFARFMSDLPGFYFLDGQRYADYYIRFEHLQRDYDEVCRRLQLPRQRLPRTKSRLREGGDDYRDYYTDWSRAHVARELAPIIAAFGYRFQA